jgi:Spy/CpxP family protein refolding chaperone
LLAFSLAAGTALAQAPPSAPPPPPAWHGHGGQEWMQRREMMQEYRIERLRVLLDLTAAQQQKVKAILAEERASMKPSLQQMRQAARQLQAAHRAARKDAMEKLAAVLTPVQMKKLKLLMPEHRRFMPRGGMGIHRGMMGPPGPGPR